MTVRQRERILSDTEVSCSRTYTKYDTCAGTSIVTDAAQGTSYKYATEYMEDIVTPSFARQSREGKVIINPLTQIKQTLEVSKAYRVLHRARIGHDMMIGSTHYHCPSAGSPPTWRAGDLYSGYYPATVLGCCEPTVLLSEADSLPDIDTSHLQQLAITQAFASIDFSEASLFETLAELDKTFKFLASTIFRAIRIFRAARRLDYKYLRREISAKQLADRYMELRYGLRPLIYDIKNIKNTLRFSKFNDRYTFRGSQNDSTYEVVTRQSDQSSGARTRFYTKRLEKRVSVRAGVLTAIEADSPPSIWGMDQPVETLWELIPFSFIADWFFNIGQTLASWTPNFGTKTLGSWCTITTKLYGTETLDYTQINTTPYWDRNYLVDAVHTETTSNCYTEAEMVTKVRQPNPKRAIFPTFTVNLDLLKILDLAIIAKSIFSGKNPRRSKKLRL